MVSLWRQHKLRKAPKAAEHCLHSLAGSPAQQLFQTWRVLNCSSSPAPLGLETLQMTLALIRCENETDVAWASLSFLARMPSCAQILLYSFPPISGRKAPIFLSLRQTLSVHPPTLPCCFRALLPQLLLVFLVSGVFLCLTVPSREAWKQWPKWLGAQPLDQAAGPCVCLLGTATYLLPDLGQFS